MASSSDHEEAVAVTAKLVDVASPGSFRITLPLPDSTTTTTNDSDTAAVLSGLRARLHIASLAVHANPHQSDYNHLTPFGDDDVIATPADLTRMAAAQPPLIDRCMGSLVGLAVADALGAPLEFLPVANESGQGRSSFDLQTLEYHEPWNKFGLLPGQWTDDSSMALCMADSLLAHARFDGGDCRIRFWHWWHTGYNNAFRKMPGEKDPSPSNPKRVLKRHSIGLGGNISRSLGQRAMSPGKPVPAVYEAETQDAGNGSVMRLAPIAIFHHAGIARAEADAVASSYTTHPGPIAAEACRFLAHLLVRCFQGDFERQCAGGSKAFLIAVADEYEAKLAADPERANAPGVVEARRMLRAAEPTRAAAGASTPQRGGMSIFRSSKTTTQEEGCSTERCWNWRSGSLAIGETMKARGDTYNGYPNSAGYFGSYCLDGLAMALHSVAETSSFDEAVAHCINLLGDADSTGAITGQIAGAMYGYSSINPTFVEWLNQWDDGHIGLRAALLATHPHRDTAQGGNAAGDEAAAFAHIVSLRVLAFEEKRLANGAEAALLSALDARRAALVQESEGRSSMVRAAAASAYLERLNNAIEDEKARSHDAKSANRKADALNALRRAKIMAEEKEEYGTS